MSTGLELNATSETTRWGFKRVVCGVDDTPESFECVPQAVALADPEADVEAVAVVDRGLAMHAGIHVDEVERDLREGAERALRRIRAAYPRATAGILRGAEASTLLEAARDADSDLVAVGSHDASRALGIALGSVATSVIHRAPCSVLIARTHAALPFPDGILVATDGSDDAGRAVAVAARIASRYGSRVALLQVGDPRGARSAAEDATRVLEMTGNEPWIEVRQGSTAHEIERFASACRASLVVVGSRGLGGVRALGSVSERVAHRAPCSVLIVRGEPASDAGEGAR